MQIGIAGAGLLGRLLAWRLSNAGHRVTVFDPAADAKARGAAGFTAAGMLSPIAELECADAKVAALGWRSLDLWAGIAAHLPRPVGFRREGSLLLAHACDGGSAKRLLDAIDAKSAAPAARPEALTAAQLRTLEPDVQGPALGWLLRGEGQIHTLEAMQALADGASRSGVRWCWSHAVQRIAPGLIDGQRFDHVFDVRGLGARPDLPLRGVRGEIVWLHAPGLKLRRPLRLLHPRNRVYLVPRADEIVVVGASEIESEDRSPISLRTLVNLLSAAHSVVPELAEARVVHTETNLRPALPDNLPQLDAGPALTRINGLFRHGWLIAPALVEDALREAGFDEPIAVRGEEEAMLR
jgi:glycine oxidase